MRNALVKIYTQWYFNGLLVFFGIALILIKKYVLEESENWYLVLIGSLLVVIGALGEYWSVRHRGNKLRYLWLVLVIIYLLGTFAYILN